MKFKVLGILIAALATSGLGCSKGLEINESFANYGFKQNLRTFSSEEMQAIDGGEYTFETAEGEIQVNFFGIPVTATAASRDPNRVMLQPAIQQACAAGEMDILRAANDCNLDLPFLMNVKDHFGERNVLKVDNIGALTKEELAARLTQGTLFAGSSAGGELQVLACLDSDKDGSCTDEAILDLNKESEELLPILKAAKANANVGAGEVSFATNCAKYQKGLLLFNSHAQLRTARSDQVSAGEAASIRVSGILNNLQAEATVMVQANGVNDVTIPVRLAEFAPNVCVVPKKRTNGCFAKGTKIDLGNGKSEKVEKLFAGDSVLLANGKRSTIYKVVAGAEKEAMIEFTTQSGEKLMVTNQHPMSTEAGIKPAYQVTAGDRLQIAKGSFASIRKVEIKKTNHKVYNFELAGVQDEDHLVIANGIVSGELFLQNKLSLENPSQKIPFYLSGN